ncbi:MAG: PcfJ domain-containing protein, partial [Anaerovoracaceae bacterium]
DRATAGKTGIFVIRLKSAPDTSLVTVEIRDGKLVQCRAKGNQQPDDDVQAFADRWMKEIVKKKGKRKAA